MAEGGPPFSKRARLVKEDLNALSKDELIEKCQEQESTIETLNVKLAADTKADELLTLRESEERLRQQQTQATHRENVLVMRLTTKDQQLQDYMNQMEELKQANSAASSKVRDMLLSPAVNMMFRHMRSDMGVCKEKLEQAQNDLAAWKFTPDSQTGKRLMAKCRMLLSENEELGKIIASGRIAKLEGEISLEKKFVEEMKISQAETDEFLVDMDEDLEGMQSTIYLLQQQLKEAKTQIAHLQTEKAALCREHTVVKHETVESVNNWSPYDNRTAIGSDTKLDDTSVSTTTTLATTNGCHKEPHSNVETAAASIDLNRETDIADNITEVVGQRNDTRLCSTHDSQSAQNSPTENTLCTVTHSEVCTSPSVDSNTKLLNQYSSSVKPASPSYRTEGLASMDCIANGVLQQYDSQGEEPHSEST